jgi:hypothetical protein
MLVSWAFLFWTAIALFFASRMYLLGAKPYATRNSQDALRPLRPAGPWRMRPQAAN